MCTYRMIAQLEHLTDAYLVQNGEANHVDQFYGLTRALDLNSDKTTVELTFVKQAVEQASKNNGTFFYSAVALNRRH